MSRAMKHNCQDSGQCYLERHVVKFDAFEGLFPRGINFMDIDATVEYRGMFLEMEWKGGASLFGGHALSSYIERKTQHGFVGFIEVVGDAHSMSVSQFRIWWFGKPSHWVRGDINALKEYIVRWKGRIDDYHDKEVSLETGEA